MINHFYGNLFDIIESTKPEVDDEINFIIHGCNAQGRMNSGFAKEVRTRFPGAYQAYYDEYVKNNNHLELGTIINYPHNDHIIITNAVTQQFYGYDGKKYISYDTIDYVFDELNKTAKTILDLGMASVINFHFPKIGAALGGGNWETIETIIDFRVTHATKNLYELT